MLPSIFFPFCFFNWLKFYCNVFKGPCYPGTYADTDESGEGYCRPCPRGFYQPYYLRIFCYRCYYNMYQHGARSCSSPPAKKIVKKWMHQLSFYTSNLTFSPF